MVPKLAEAWESARAADRGWCLFSYAASAKAKIVPVAHGTRGYSEMVTELLPDAVNYAVFAATVDGRQRFIFLTVIGEQTSAIKRGKAAMHAPHMEKFFDGTAGALPVLTAADELDEVHMNGLLKTLCKGSKEAVVR